MIDVSTQNFTEQVIQASRTTPVLVDFWAPWCGPCKALGPVLEKLETAYQGGFILAKLNTDENPQISAQVSQMLGVRSIPLCVMFKDGQVADAFVGAVPEAQVREFLDRWVTPPAAAPEPQELTPAQQLAQWRKDLQAKPEDTTLRFNLARALARQGQMKEAQTTLQPALGAETAERRLHSLADWLALLQAAPAARDETALQEVIARNKRDFSARFELAELCMRASRWADALESLLEIIMRDRAWQDDQARKTYIAILDINDDNAALLDEYRKKLSMVLF